MAAATLDPTTGLDQTAARRTPSAGARAGAALGEATLAAIVAAGVAAVGLVAFSVVHWPAFNSSNELRALTTVGQFVCVAVLGIAIALVRWQSAKARQRRLATLLSWAGLSGFVTVTLGLPLAATKLYLFGISVDQEFRTEYLTRLTDSPALHDMTYVDVPPYYPAGWFWLGGRAAKLLGMSGWEVFKPYGIVVIAVAAVVALVLWSKLIRADLAVVTALATTAVLLAYASPEPYGAPIAILLIPALVLAWGGLHRPELGSTSAVSTSTGRGWGAVVGTGLFLGLAATFYTLYLAVAAGTVTLMAVIAFGIAVRTHRSWRAGLPVVSRLAVAAAIAAVVGMVVWLPFVVGLRNHTMSESGTAFHYLPESGAQLAFPMLRFTLLGGLCLIGTLWLALRASTSRRAQAIGIGVLAIYLWSLASMAFTVLGTTLLSFRLEPILTTLLAAAGVFGFVEGAYAVYLALHEPSRFRVAAVVVGTTGALAFSQDIPHVLANEITTAYTDTDGNGVRADQRHPSAVSYYGKVDQAIAAQRRRPQHDTVVLTADTSFLAYYPYYGFQGRTSHYANPLADYQARSAVIESWSRLKTPAQLQHALAESPWRAPDVFLFRQSGDTYTLRLARDVYPNDPNVERYTVAFPKALFDSPAFTKKQIGPFVVIVRR